METEYLHGRWTERKANRIEVQEARDKEGRQHLGFGRAKDSG